ncbi:MAG: hypothetical protein AAGC68_06310, partial [Verrucomicrobiota bacterium]
MKSNKASATEILNWLDEVVSGTNSFAEREQGIERARQLKDSNLRSSIVEQKTEIQRWYEREVETLQDEGEMWKGRIDEVFAARGVRIDQAQIEVRNQVIARLQESEGQRKGLLQRDYMEAGRRRENDLASAEARHEAESSEYAGLQGRYVR